MKIFNISKSSIQLYLKDKDGTDATVLLQVGEFVFSPTNEKTKSINLHGLKKNIGLSIEDKPEYLEYFKPYKEHDIIIATSEEIISKDVLNIDVDNLDKIDVINSDYSSINIEDLKDNVLELDNGIKIEKKSKVIKKDIKIKKK